MGLLLVLSLLATAQPGRVCGQGLASAADDSLAAAPTTYWGLWPVRSDSVTAEFREDSRPAWETVVMTPYWVVGLPFRGLYYLGGQALVGLDDLNLFAGTSEYPGLPGPARTYTMPTIKVHGQEGVTFGLDVRRPDFLGRGNLLFIKADRTTKRAGSYGGGALLHLGDDWDLQTGGGFESRSKARYHGLGVDSRQGDLSYYYRSVAWGGTELSRRLTPIVQAGARLYFSQVRTLPARYDRELSIERIHPDDFPLGYPGQSNGWTLRLGLDRDSTAQNGRPRAGSFQALGASLFRASDAHDLSYLTWHANAERYFRLWHSDRTLAVRGFANRITDVGRAAVPLSRLVTFQRPDELRGFSSLRFYGKGSVGVSVEYRWPLWVVRGRDDLGVDAYLFSDSGQVFDHTREISLANFNWTAGGGLRLVNGGRGLSGRLELGFSGETTVLRLAFSQTFQYEPRGFLYGKNPTKVY